MTFADEIRTTMNNQKKPKQETQVSPTTSTPPEILAYEAFPTNALPEPIRGFVDAGSRAMGCDPCYIALPLLCALGAIIGNTRRLMLKKSWLVTPILWAAIVGESGTLKSPAFKLALTPLRNRQAKAFKRYQETSGEHEQALAKYERDLANWKKSKTEGAPPEKPKSPVCHRQIVNDVTIEALAPILQENPRGVLLESDELAGWIGSFDRYAAKGGKSGGDSSKWLSIYNADAIIIDRKTGVPPTIHVPRPSVCVVGEIQPAILKLAFSEEHRHSGLVARLLLASPPRIPKKWTEADIDESEHAKIDRLFNLLGELDFDRDSDDLKPQAVKLNREARDIWSKYYDAHHREQTDLEGDMASAWSKLEEYAAQLALVLHFVRWASGETADPMTLDANTLRMGITFTDWFKNEAKRVYAMLDENETDAQTRKLLEFIQRKGGAVTIRDVQRGMWSLRHSDIEKELDKLKTLGWGDWVDKNTNANGGRPTRVFHLVGESTHRHIDETLKKDADARRTPQNDGEIHGFVDVETVDPTEAQELSSRDHQDHTEEPSDLP